jgi:hypothetical protein
LGFLSVAGSLPGKSALIEILLLFRPHRAPEDRVAMRKSSEAADDVAVSLGMGQARLSEPTGERHRSFLVGQVFGMAERQIKEEL